MTEKITAPHSVYRTWTAIAIIPDQIGFRSADDVRFEVPWSEYDLQADQLKAAARFIAPLLGADDIAIIELFKNTKAHGNVRDTWRTVERSRRDGKIRIR
jgi:hypothetical protein